MDPTRGGRPVTRLGCWLTGPLLTSGGSPALDQVSGLALAAERAGFDSFWVSDQEAPARSGADARLGLEAYSLLGALAVRTTVVHLGAIPMAGERRAPSMVAKIITGIDVISHGRGILTIGTDGQGQSPAAAMIDAVRVGRSMLTDEVPSVSGPIHSIQGAFNRPKPLQLGGVPLVAMVGGDHHVSSDTWAALASLADAVLVSGGPDEVAAARTALRSATQPVGEDPDVEPRGVQVIGMVTADGAAASSTDRTSSDFLSHPGAPGVVDSARGLFAAGADGCLISVGMGTSADEIAHIGDALHDEQLDAS